MTTYGDNTANRFFHFVRAGYRYTYGLVDFMTGEIRTLSCDHQYAPLKTLYGYLDGRRRECERRGEPYHLLLVNCRTGESVAEVKAQ